jgi:hypothetical protein
MKTCFGALVWAFAAVSVGAGVVPLDLRCEGTRQALAVSAAPRFSWRVESAKRGQSQTAWQILVASKAEILADDRGDLWDSGKTAATRTPWVKYAGSPLSSGARYHWKVRCRDAGDQPDAWSEPAVMEIAPTKPADWQGASWIDDGRDNPENDGGNAVHAARYEQNLVQFIKQLRKDFEAPNAKFVLATLGETKKGSEGNGGKILDAHFAVDGATGKHKEFKGNVATVYSNPLSNGGSGNGHYNGNAGTYINVGEAMGREMVKLLGAKSSTF